MPDSQESSTRVRFPEIYLIVGVLLSMASICLSKPMLVRFTPSATATPTSSSPPRRCC